MAEGRHKAIPSCSAVDMSGWPHCGRSITTWGAAATLPPELSSSPRPASPILCSNHGSCAGKLERASSNGQRSPFKIVQSPEGCGQQSTWSLPSGYQVHGQLQLGLC